MTIAGRGRVSEALRSFGRAFFELADAVEKLDEPGREDALMQQMEREAVGKPVKSNGMAPHNGH